MNWKEVLWSIGIIILAGPLYGQSNRESITCKELLYRDLFKSIHLPQDQRRDDILYLKVVKKQFDPELRIKSINGYGDNEVLIASIYDEADISCLAIGEFFEIMIVLDIELAIDSLMNLPKGRLDIQGLVDGFSEKLDVPNKLEYLLCKMSAPRCVSSPPLKYEDIRSPSKLIKLELDKLSRPLKLKNRPME